MTPTVIFVDVDDTLVRTVGTKRVPMVAVVAHVRELREQGAVLYCWSSGGAEYARSSARELGIEEVFAGFLPKPHAIIDDQAVGEWRRCVQVYPGEVGALTLTDYRPDE